MIDNQKATLQRLREGYLKIKYPEKRFGPSQIVLKMTNGCNLRCIYCYSNAGETEKIKFINPDMVLDFFDQYFEICHNAVVNCTFHGGEPLLNAELIKSIINKLKGRFYYPRIKFSIQTNGTLISENNIDLLKEYFPSVGVSFDGINEIQKETRPKANGDNSFYEFERGINLLGSHGISCGALLVMTNKNKNHLIQTLNWCASHGVSGVGIEMVFPGGRGREQNNLPFSPDEYYEIMKEALFWQIGYNQSAKDKFYIRDFRTIVEKIVYQSDGHMCANIPCGAGSTEISLDFNGNVYVCDSFDGMDDYIMGNIYKEKLANILDAPIVKKFTCRSLEDIECKECAQKSICILGCPVRNLISNNKSLFERNYMCSYYKKISKLLYELVAYQNFDPDLFTAANNRRINIQKICF